MLPKPGTPATPRGLVALRAEQAKAAGIGGIVCSPREAEMVRAIVGPALAMVTPGIRAAPAADAGDQKRISAPAEAVAAGATISSSAGRSPRRPIRGRRQRRSCGDGRHPVGRHPHRRHPRESGDPVHRRRRGVPGSRYSRDDPWGRREGMADLRVAIAGAGGRMGAANIRAVNATAGLVVHSAFERPGSPAIGPRRGRDRRHRQRSASSSATMRKPPWPAPTRSSISPRPLPRWR